MQTNDYRQIKKNTTKKNAMEHLKIIIVIQYSKMNQILALNNS